MILGTLSKVGICFFTIILIAACAQQTGTNYDTSNAEIVGEAIAGAANAADGTTVVARNKEINLPLNEKFKMFASDAFLSKAYGSLCSQTIFGQTCVAGSNGNNVVNMSLSCVGEMGTWSGNYTVTFDSTLTCSTVTGSASGFGMVSSTGSVTFTAPLSGGGIVLSSLGFKVTTDSDKSGYSVQKSGGIGIGCGGSGCGVGRTVTVNGLHRALTGPSGTTLIDHTISTNTPLSVTGTGGNKKISSGTLMLQHNLAKFTMTSQITQTLGFTAGCCYPISGQVTTTYSNGKTGPETMTFGPACGAGTVGGAVVNFNYCM